MSTRSKFERRLGFREAGFSIKIPDAGRSLKPFDYVVGVPVSIGGIETLRFVAIEAKTARGWVMPGGSILPHQYKALDLVESLAPYSAWLAIGFLDMPKMSLNWDRQRLDKKMKAEAYLLWWEDAKFIERENGSIRYKDIIRYYKTSRMDYVKVGSGYKWIPAQGGSFYSSIAHQNM